MSVLVSSDYIPIKCLNTFLDEWVIKARVVSRCPLRPYEGKKRGVVFNAELIDESGTKIQANFFNQAAEKWDPLIQEGKVYKMGGGQLRIANKRYTSIQNDYCIYFNAYSVIQEIPEDANIPDDIYEFCSIKEALKSSIGRVLDLIAVVQAIDSPVEIQTKKGDRIKKIVIYVIDDGEVPTNITNFGDQCDEIYSIFTQLKPLTVVGFKECRVSEFRDVISLTLNRSATIIIEPIYPRAQKLKKWVAKKKKDGVDMPKAQASSFTKAPLNTLSSIVLLENDLLEGKSEGYLVRFNGMVGRILTPYQNTSYMACPTCQKKVVDGGNQFYCQKCDDQITTPVLLFAFTFVVKDHTNSIIARVFRDQGEKVIGMKPHQVKEKVDNDLYQELSDKRKKLETQEKNFLVRSRLQVYNGQRRVDYTVLRVGVKDVLEENKMLIDKMKIFLERLKIPPSKRR